MGEIIISRLEGNTKKIKKNPEIEIMGMLNPSFQLISTTTETKPLPWQLAVDIEEMKKMILCLRETLPVEKIEDYLKTIESPKEKLEYIDSLIEKFYKIKTEIILEEE